MEVHREEQRRAVQLEMVTHGSVGGVVEAHLGDQEGAPLLLPNFGSGAGAANPLPTATSLLLRSLRSLAAAEAPVVGPP